MNRFKRWTLAVFWSIVASVGIIVAINIIVDADGIFWTDLSRQFQPPNMSFAKVRYLLREKSRFDSFLFGSSRVGNIDVAKIENGRYYNMFYAAGLPEEHLDHIRFLLKNGVRIKNILIGLDDFSFLFDPRDHLSELDLQPHPFVSGKNLWTFYGEYIFKLNRVASQLKAFIRHNYTQKNSPGENRFIYDIYGSGRVLCRDCDAEIERNVNAHINSVIFSLPEDYRFVEGDFMEQALSAMRQLADLARRNSIKLVVFINPIHRTTYLHSHLELFARFKKELADITDYYDFSGLNSITTNNYYWHETSHYRLMVGDMMLKVMFGRPDIHVPGDFGFYVTRTNIAAHLLAQCREIRKVREELPASNGAYADSCDDLQSERFSLPMRHLSLPLKSAVVRRLQS